LRKTRLLILGLIIALVTTAALLVSCFPTTTDTDTGTDGTTTTGSSWTSTLLMVGFVVLIFVMMYFFTIRPQRKRQQDQSKMIQELQRGDRVVTIGGLYGTVESVSEDSVTIRVESGTTMRFVKSAIATKVDQQPQTGPK
jgi:preprotein translocase subunit YajC